MNAQQKLADQREKAQIACAMLRGNQDVLHEVSVPLIAARRAFDAIAIQGVDSVAVITALMDSITEAASMLDDILGDIWEIMEPEEEREENVEKVALTNEEKAKAMYEKYMNKTTTSFPWDMLSLALRESWIRMAERTADYEEGTAG